MSIISAIVSILGGWRAAVFAVIALLAISANGVQTLRLRSAAAAMTAHLAADAKATAAAELASRTREYEAAVASAKVAQDYEKAKQDAQTKSDSVVADLRAGNLRLRGLWLGCQADVSTIAAGPAVIDAGVAERAESAARIIGAAAECDAQVKSLQDFLQTERQ